MKKLALILGVLFCFAPFFRGAGLNIQNYRTDDELKPGLVMESGGFRLKTSVRQGKISAAFRHPAAAQLKLYFTLAGNAANRRAKLRPVIFFRKGAEERSASAPALPLNRPEEVEYALGLDTDFGLSDALYDFCRLELVIENPECCEIEFRFCRAGIAEPGESGATARPMVLSSPHVPEKRLEIGLPPVRIHFHWDNDDLDPKPLHGDIRYRDRSQKNVGFSALLLEQTNGLFHEVPTTAEADVIVTGSPVPTGRGAEFAAAVKTGKKLLVYGQNFDPELEPLLPLKLVKRPSEGLPERLPIRFADCELFQGKTTALRFPRYFDTTLRRGEVLAAFPDGSPFIARCGNVIQFACGPGIALRPRTLFYDHLLLRAALPSAAEYATKLEELETVEIKRRETTEKARLVAAGVPPGFQSGSSFENFGRFGWRVAAHLQVESISDDLTVSNGGRSYSFADADREIQVTRADWCGKEYLISGKHGERRMIFSLLSPLILYRFRQDTVPFTVTGNAEFAACRTSRGIRVRPLDQEGLFYDRRRDGAWNAPYLLLFRRKEDAPLLLVFSANPEKISLRREGSRCFFTVHTAKKVLDISAGWLHGRKQITLSPEADRLPFAQIETLLGFARNFPVGCDEFFRIDRCRRQIEFIHRMRYLKLRSEWKLPEEQYALLPPMIVLAAGEGFATLPEALVDFDIETVYGPMRGVRGSSSVRFQLPMAPEEDLIPPGVTDPVLFKSANDYFLDGSRWSARRVPAEAWTPENPTHQYPDIRNINFFAWNFGLGTALQGALFLTSENRAVLEKRVRKRFLEPLELFQYKYFARHREEPFSRLRYPLLFNSAYSNDTNFAPGMGSAINYGDCNEACTVAAWIGQQLADRFGQSDVIRANWPYFRYMMRHQKCINDYAYLAGSCRESGVGSWVDMLNAEMCGEIAYARLAELAGDKRERDLALCRAAKKTVPTLLRFRFRKYLGGTRQDFQVTGFSEEGAKMLYYPNRSYNFFVSNELFDFSQGLHGSLCSLYLHNVLPEIREYLKSKAIPSIFTPGKNFLRHDYLQVFALFGDDMFPVYERARELAARPPSRSDLTWAGMRIPFHFALVLRRTNLGIALAECRELNLRRAWYDPATRTFELDLDAGWGSKLVVSSWVPLVSATRNGQSIVPESGPSGRTIPIKPGRNHIIIRY